MNTKQLKNIVKDAVREVMEEEMFKMRLLLTPEVSDEEQSEIEKTLGNPSKYKRQIINHQMTTYH